MHTVRVIHRQQQVRAGVFIVKLGDPCYLNMYLNMLVMEVDRGLSSALTA
jgi:hypothetical protein